MSSLGARVWLAVVALAAINIVCGVLAFLVAHFVFSNWQVTFIGAFVVSTIITVLYGRWLSAEILRPVEKVNLAAKSLERNFSSPMPVTTGSVETDAILDSLQRNSKQLNNLVTLMDDVASGRTETAMMPLEHADRLSSSFQKLVAKVTDSIDAKKDLEELRSALSRLSIDISAAVHTQSPVDAANTSGKTAEIAAAFNLILERLERTNSRSAGISSAIREPLAGARERLDGLRNRSTSNVGSINQLIAAIKESPGEIRSLVDAAAQLRLPERESPVPVGSLCENYDISNRLALLRTHTNDLQRRFRNLRERSQSLPNTSRLAEDLARRSKMVALNASINAGSTNGKGTAIFSDEFAQFSERAGKLQRELSTIDKSIIEELAEGESTVQNILAELADAMLQSTTANDMMTELEPVLSAASGLPTLVEKALGSQQQERENMMRQLTALYFDLNKDAEIIAEAADLLADATVDSDGSAPKFTPAESVHSTPAHTNGATSEFASNGHEPLGAMLEIPGEV